MCHPVQCVTSSPTWVKYWWTNLFVNKARPARLSYVIGLDIRVHTVQVVGKVCRDNIYR